MNTMPLSIAAINWDVVRDYWEMPLIPIGGHSLLLSQVVIAVFLLGAGLIMIRMFTRWITSAVERSSRFNPHAASIVQRLTYYTLLALLVMLLMQVVGIPITSLAVLGGALAIGVGFGAQNIINNFISGLILIIEQPIRVNDMIEVGDHLGKIAAINSRCTRIRRNDGIDVLVPNSTLLENSVINWTLTDDMVRSDVEVGLAYGSDVQLARDILMTIAQEEPRVTDFEPYKPTVLFNSFGDNALVFNLYIWTHATSIAQIRQLCSDLRFEIDKRFREENLCIAFPQRDVHLDTIKPLEIKMIQGS